MTSDQQGVGMNSSTIDIDDSYSLFTLTSDSSKPYQINIEVNGNSTVFEIDTGASLSIVNDLTYRKLSENQEVPLESSSIKLRTYTGEPLHVLGVITVTVNNNTQTVQLPILVVKGKGPNLLGRDWLLQLNLDWTSVVNQVQVDNSTSLNALLLKHAEVFDGELGTLYGREITIHVEEGVRPRFFKARTDPLRTPREGGSRVRETSEGRNNIRCRVFRVGGTNCASSKA